MDKSETRQVTRDAAEKTISEALTKAGAETSEIRVLGDEETILVTGSVPARPQPTSQTVRISVPTKGLTVEAVEAAIASANLAEPR